MKNAIVSKVEENIFSIANNNETFYLVINSAIPILDNGEVKAQVRLFKVSDEKWSFEFSVPFGFVLKQFKEHGKTPTDYMLEQLKIEALRELELDFSQPFKKVLGL